MHVTGKKFSFGLVVALLLGWGALGLLLIESGNQLLQAQIIEGGANVRLPKGVRLRLEVDKNVYGQEEDILISIRNDSRTPVWLAEHADGCLADWWLVEQLFDEDQWQTLAIRRGGCQTRSYGRSEFTVHSVRTARWDGLVQTADLGEVFKHVPTGTYRIRVPFLHGPDIQAADWGQDSKAVVSDAFTVQGPETGA